MFGGVAGLFRFVTSVVPLLAINTAKVSTPESAGKKKKKKKKGQLVVRCLALFHYAYRVSKHFKTEN